MNLSATEPINWNDGRLLTLSAGQAAKCESLVKDQLYAVLIYNTSQNDIDAIVTVVWSNSYPPTKVTVHGTTGNGAAANFVFVSGNDTNFISISLNAGASEQINVTAFVVSLTMPLNTKGLNNIELPNDGKFNSFSQYDRYYANEVSGWRSVSFENKLTQFIFLQMVQTSATVFVINTGSGLSDGQIAKFGPTANANGVVSTNQISYQNYQEYIQENTGTWVWMNADSPQNSANAQIALQQLSLLKAYLNIPRLSLLSKRVSDYFKG